MINFTLRRLTKRAFLMFVMMLIVGGMIGAASPDSGYALYFLLRPSDTLPSLPSSLLIQSPSYIDVPAGAVLSVHLLRGDTLVSTSKLTFPQRFFTDRLVPPVPVASFVPTGTPTNASQPLPGATLISGQADLSKVASEPAQYRLMWALSAGVMGTPGHAIVTGVSVSFVDLKLSGVSAAASVGDQKPGSALFFNRYTSSASSPTRENSTLNLTNTSPADEAFVRLFLVDSATCQIQQTEICLMAQQTVSFQLSDLDPGVKGYAVAVAVNRQGEPIHFNWLTGNVVVKQSAPNIGGAFAVTLSAIAVAKRKEGAAPATSGNEAEMIFDDVNYDRLPAQIAFDGVPAQNNGMNATIFSLYRPVANLGGSVASDNVLITGWGTDDQNQVVTSKGDVSVTCYSEVTVSSLRLAPAPISQLLPPGSTAWFAASTMDMQPLLGIHLNSGESNSGANARALSLSSEYRIRIPVSPVTCPQ
ncbi:MAG: hypothetical protein AB7U82_32125 [Blastocatellales bacterium]